MQVISALYHVEYLLESGVVPIGGGILGVFGGTTYGLLKGARWGIAAGAAPHPGNAAFAIEGGLLSGIAGGYAGFNGTALPTSNPNRASLIMQFHAGDIQLNADQYYLELHSYPGGWLGLDMILGDIPQ